MFAFTVNKDYKFVIDKHEAKKAEYSVNKAAVQRRIGICA